MRDVFVTQIVPGQAILAANGRTGLDHVVAAWLGHANISTTSRYLKTTRSGLQQYLKRFQAHRAERCTPIAKLCQTPCQTPPERFESTGKLLN
jgi:hypothetical protein